MQFKQLMEEMRKSSGLSHYYFEMLKSIGPDWEQFIQEFCAYSMLGWDSPEAEVRIVERVRKLGERLGYICGRIREFNENY